MTADCSNWFTQFWQILENFPEALGEFPLTPLKACR
jgi:hypothetical protein